MRDCYKPVIAPFLVGSLMGCWVEGSSRRRRRESDGDRTGVAPAKLLGGSIAGKGREDPGATSGDGRWGPATWQVGRLRWERSRSKVPKTTTIHVNQFGVSNSVWAAHLRVHLLLHRDARSHYPREGLHPWARPDNICTAICPRSTFLFLPLPSLTERPLMLMQSS